MNEIKLQVIDTFDEKHPMNEYATLLRSSETGATVMLDHHKGIAFLVDLETMQSVESNDEVGAIDEQV